MLYSRTFTGAWIETRDGTNGASAFDVAPLRVRGLKQLFGIFRGQVNGVAPIRVSGCYNCTMIELK